MEFCSSSPDECSRIIQEFNVPDKDLLKLLWDGRMFLVSWRAAAPTNELDLRRCRSATPNVKSILGYTTSEFKAIEFHTLIDKRDRERVMAGCKAHTAVRQTLDLPEFRIRKKDGRFIWVKVRCVRYNLEGYAAYVKVVDIFKRKSDGLELLLEGTRLGMWDWNPQTDDFRFNERWAEMVGHSVSELPQQLSTWTTRVHLDDIKGCYRDIDRHIKGETEFCENTHRMKHKDGSWKYILNRGKVVERDENNNPTRFTGTHMDVTREKLAELRAKKALEANNIFLANMSHEIRTPLSGIVALIDHLKRMELPSEAAKYIRIIDTCSTSLSTIINDVLNVCKMDAGCMTLEKGPVSLHCLLHGVIQLFSEKASRRGVQLVYKTSSKVPKTVFSDKVRIGQVLSNLICNAIKFSPDGGKVSVTLYAKRSKDSFFDIIFSVTDKGIGIPPDKLKKIFQPFQQVNAIITRRYGGTGLGLSICKKICELMGGSISVESTEGEGSTFTCYIKCQEGNKSLQSEEQNDMNLDVSDLRVLVAEDNHVSQLVVDRHLESLGIHPTIVSNGRKCLEVFRKNPELNLILMDMHMPVMNGIEATKKIFKFCENTGVTKPYIVSLSADSFPESRKKFKDAGMIFSVSKPFRRINIKQALEVVLTDMRKGNSRNSFVDCKRQTEKT